MAAGAGVDGETGSGATPMMLAVSGGHERCVALLLEAGAQVNSPSTWLDGRTARILAEERAEAEAAGRGAAGGAGGGRGGAEWGDGGVTGVYARILVGLGRCCLPAPRHPPRFRLSVLEA